MVSSLLAEALANPTEVITTLYNKFKQDLPVDTIFAKIVAAHFKKAFNTAEQLRQIPPLDVHSPDVMTTLNQHRVLVRFRGMVQSTEPEVYRSELSDRTLGGWGLAEEETFKEVPAFDSAGGEDVKLDDRAAIWVTSVPGESAWIREDVDGLGPSKKLLHRTISTQPHKFPFPKCTHLAMNVKMYGDPSSVPELTEVHTFVGILTRELLVVGPEELDTPTLHVLFSRPHSFTSASFPFPMKISQSPAKSTETLQYVAGSSAEGVRSSLIEWIADEGLAGDKEAAEWILLSVISRMHSRSPPIMPLSITVSGFPLPPTTPTTSSSERPSLEPTINHVLSIVLPTLIHLPLTIKLLNESRFAPISKNEDLHSGALQLPGGSTIIVSEAGISEGTLNETGVKNVHTLKNCALSQTLGYEFPYNTYTFNTELNFLVLAQGKISPFIATDLSIPLRPKNPSPEFTLYKDASQVTIPSEDKLSSFRALIGGAKIGKLNIHEDVSEYIQADFVRERQFDNKATPEDLILRMSIARSLTLSLHETSLTKDLWDRTKTLDSRRKQRLLD